MYHLYLRDMTNLVHRHWVFDDQLSLTAAFNDPSHGLVGLASVLTSERRGVLLERRDISPLSSQPVVTVTY
jgi:hypothetical protein